MKRVRTHNMAKALARDDGVGSLREDPRPVARVACSAARARASPRACRSASRTRSSSCWRRSRKERAAGYQRIKIKIKPGWDVEAVERIRAPLRRHPAHGRRQRRLPARRRAHLARLDPYDLMMIEQPLEYDDVMDHVALQQAIDDADLPRRVDSHRPHRARRDRRQGLPHHQHQAGPGRRPPARRSSCTTCAPPHDIPVWHGGMLESGIGRAHNIHLASLPNFRLPGDIARRKRYYVPDLIEPAIDIADEAPLRCRTGPGIGVRCFAIAWRRRPNGTWSSTPARLRDDERPTAAALAAVLADVRLRPEGGAASSRRRRRSRPRSRSSPGSWSWRISAMARGPAAGQDLVTMLHDPQAHIRRRAALAAGRARHRRRGRAVFRRCSRPNPIPRSARWRRLRSG